MDFLRKPGFKIQLQQITKQWKAVLNAEKLRWSHVCFLDFLGVHLWSRTYTSRINRSCRWGWRPPSECRVVLDIWIIKNKKITHFNWIPWMALNVKEHQFIPNLSTMMRQKIYRVIWNVNEDSFCNTIRLIQMNMH